jgi:hypothetical protein
MKLFILIFSLQSTFIAKYSTKLALSVIPTSELVLATRKVVQNSFEREDNARNLVEPLVRGITRGVLDGNRMAAVGVLGRAVKGGVKDFVEVTWKSINRYVSK